MSIKYGIDYAIVYVTRFLDIDKKQIERYLKTKHGVKVVSFRLSPE